MKKLTSPLLIVSLCIITLFSCGGNSSNASIEGSDKSEKLIERNNSNDKLSKKEAIDRMNNANLDPNMDPNKSTGASQLVNNLKSQQARKMGEDQAEQSSREQRRRYEEVKDLPASEGQKVIANEICNCLNKNPLFKTALKSKSSEALVKSLGEDKDNEVRALQNCYNNIMVPAVKNLGKDAGIFSRKSREYLNEECLSGSNDFWIQISDYITRNNRKNVPMKDQ